MRRLRLEEEADGPVERNEIPPDALAEALAHGARLAQRVRERVAGLAEVVGPDPVGEHPLRDAEHAGRAEDHRVDLRGTVVQPQRLERPVVVQRRRISDPARRLLPVARELRRLGVAQAAIAQRQVHRDDRRQRRGAQRQREQEIAFARHLRTGSTGTRNGGGG
ncbi:hypothetical protein D3C83_11950 [compost metagenome]